MEEYTKIFQKFYRRLAAEGFVKSLLWGAGAGFAVNLILGVVFYCIQFEMLWLSVVCGAAVLAAVAAILYFAKYRPTIRQVAERVDRLGLKERLITMVELQGDDSYMAVRQREDALAHLQKAGAQKLKLNVRAAAVISVCVLALFSCSVTAAAALSLAGELPSIDEILPAPEEETVWVQVEYMADEGGRVEDAAIQIIPKGGDCEEVLAVADDGYVFDIWSDGVTTPDRKDTNVGQSMTVYALFIKVNDEQADGEKSDEVGDVNENEGGGNMPSDGGAAGKYEEYNQVIDGETYYRDIYREYYDKAMQILDEGGVVPAYIRLIIQDYFDVIV